MTDNPIKLVANGTAAKPTQRQTLPRRRVRRSAWMRGEEPQQEGVGLFNRVPPGYRPRVRRSSFMER